MYGIHNAKRLGVFATILILTACAGAGASETTVAAVEDTTVEQSTTTTTAETTTTRPADAAPQELVGIWKAPSTDPAFEICLSLGANNYSHSDCGGTSISGTHSFDGDMVTFTSKMLGCPDGVGVYAWEFDGEVLTLTELDPPDECDIRRDHLDGRPFTR